MHKRLILIFIFILIVEFIALQAPVTVFGPSPALFALYFGATLAAAGSMAIVFNSSLRAKLRLPDQLWTGIFFVLFFPKFLIAVCMLGEDVFRLAGTVVNGIAALADYDALFSTNRSELWSITALVIAGLLTVTFIYGSIFNVYNYRVRKVKVQLLKLPKAFHGLRVVQISDIHSGSLRNREAVQKAVDTINGLSPDLIFFTGDLVNNIADEAKEFIDIFRKLQARHGVYSVLGNHDYGDYMAWPDASAKEANLATLKSMHAEMGWRLLLNEHVHIEKDGERIVVAGVENWSARGRFKSYGKLTQALHGLQDAFTILLLSHDPSHWEAEILDHPAQVDMTFAGHTHGMQFGFEWLRFKWSPVQYIYRQWAGLYRRNEQYLYVNRGFGVIGYQGRVGILPEITLFTLQTANA